MNEKKPVFCNGWGGGSDSDAEVGCVLDSGKGSGERAKARCSAGAPFRALAVRIMINLKNPEEDDAGKKE